jgi:hypothetical protein
MSPPFCIRRSSNCLTQEVVVSEFHRLAVVIGDVIHLSCSIIKSWRHFYQQDTALCFKVRDCYMHEYRGWTKDQVWSKRMGHYVPTLLVFCSGLIIVVTESSRKCRKIVLHSWIGGKCQWYNHSINKGVDREILLQEH